MAVIDLSCPPLPVSCQVVPLKCWNVNCTVTCPVFRPCSSLVHLLVRLVDKLRTERWSVIVHTVLTS